MSVALSLPAPREAGFGPQWWRSGTRTRWWWAGLVLTLGGGTMVRAVIPCAS
jgi:hypothetical protein